MHIVKRKRESLLNNHRFRDERLKSVQRADANGRTYTTFEIDGERFHGSRSAIELLLKKQQIQTTFPRKPVPFGLDVAVYAFDEMLEVLARFRAKSRACGALNDKEEPTERDDCISRWAARTCTARALERDQIAHGV